MIYCEFCDQTYIHYKSHIKRKKHLKSKFNLIDKNLDFLPKDVNKIIFSYHYDSEEDLRVLHKQMELFDMYNPPLTFYEKCIKTMKFIFGLS